MGKIVLAGGCFWGIEAYFNTIDGVVYTKVGYANGNTKNPTYGLVCKNNTGFAEACYIEYDDNIIKLEQLLSNYWKVIDPTVKDRQGHDIGTQYRTGIYYFDGKDVEVIKKSKENEQRKYKKIIVTEVEPLKNFYDAEEYHQKYLDKNPNGYCHIPKELLVK
ncbi:peptide-methionine (S)-S-oxide reductase MsrA [Clostridium kluyveri]|uniref:Peptide methionine sulfoxide reductase MsrA n=1 Tax=Clostridium kluyveri TaxID=1534 RepID=A0A1L5F8J9_CLOKL|nr:peptide-methionine (S)-S-oxide reductase MsrA [Clostridium kluyveri]APM39356.1 peptide-methionine (S)-S-oxide reductase [Clostridium kluyveri]UZQ50453.1 peptide-methionine (S)-S-oxide reductase MsrA [Clostridium kluyveri]